MAKKQEDRMVLAEGCIYSMDSSKTQCNNNVIVCGTSGAGKTVSVTEPCLLYVGERSLVVRLSKRRLAERYRAYLGAKGYQVCTIDFTNPERSSFCYNPMIYLKNDLDVTMFAKMVVGTVYGKEGTKADPYWEQAAVSLLSAEIAYVRLIKTYPSFSEVLELNDRLRISPDGAGRRTTLDELFREIESDQPDSLCANCWRSFIGLPEKTASCVYGTLNSILDTLFPTPIRTMMKRAISFPAEKLSQQKMVLFLVTSAVNPALNQYINLFYAQVFKCLFECAERRTDGRLERPVHLICDDFAVGGTICNFAEYISIFREKGISVTLLLQSESQLTAMYGKNDAVTILNNADTYVYMGGMDLETAKSMSLRLNAPLEEVLYMPIGEVAVLRRGARPVRTTRYRTYEDPRYLELVRSEKKAQEALR